MTNYTATDLQALARGRSVPPEVFRSIFADPAAVADLARLLQVRQLHEVPAPEIPEPPPLPVMDVTFEELARHGERRLHDPQRVAAVEAFLARHFPTPPEVVAGQDTVIETRASEETTIRPPAGPKGDRPKPPPAGA
jgi:hypothetical protein